MIRSYFGLTDNPFAMRDATVKLLTQQQEIHDTLRVHCQQGGLCLVVGRPGTGKSVIKDSLTRLPEKEYLVATIARTLHTYTNTVKILCEAFRIEFESSAFKCERKLIQEAVSLNRSGKMLVTVIDDAHLMGMENLRKLRLLGCSRLGSRGFRLVLGTFWRRCLSYRWQVGSQRYQATPDAVPDPASIRCPKVNDELPRDAVPTHA
jgi:type II secretory pathway predicted ATPase ExeA